MASELGRLIITTPDEPERAFEITAAITRIGRESAQSDIVLAHGWVSRAHARLYGDRLPVRIQDMRSSNGTVVNDRPLPPEEIRALQDGDVIAIGPFRLRYEAPPSAPAEPPAGLPEGAAPRLDVRPAPAGPAAPPPEPPAPDTVARPALEPWVGMPTRGGSRWLQYLPPLYAEDDFLGRFLSIFEDLLGPPQQIIAHWSQYLAPRTTPESFLPWLNSWLDNIADERLSSDVTRELVANASWLYQARGTRAGLLRFIAICTGCQAEITENGQGPHSLRVVVHSAGQALERPMLERIVAANCPAHVAYIIEID